MLNHIVLMGRLTRPPELRKTTAGVPVAAFSLACDRDYKDKETGERATDFVDCVAWRGTAEFAAKYLDKGRLIAVSGRLETQDWTDKDGNKRRSIKIRAENIYFADSKRTENGDAAAAQGGGEGVPAQDVGTGTAAEPAAGSGTEPDGFAELGPGFEGCDDNLPF